MTMHLPILGTMSVQIFIKKEDYNHKINRKEKYSKQKQVN